MVWIRDFWRGGRACSTCSSYGALRFDVAHQHGIGRGLLGAALGLDRHRHGVGPFHGVLDHGSDRVPFGLEEAAWLRSIALYYPDLVGLALRCGGHVLGHQYRPIALEGNQLRLYPLLRPRSPERDHLGTLGLVLGLALEAPNAALQIPHLSLQEHAPGEQADREHGRGSKGEVAGTHGLPQPAQPRPALAGTGLYGLRLHSVHDPAAEIRGGFLFPNREGQKPSNGAQLLHLSLQVRVRREVLLELQALLLRQGAEDVGVLEILETFLVHTVHLGTADPLAW